MDDDEFIVQILGISPTNNAIASITGDLQSIPGQRDYIIEIEEFKFIISKILIIDYIETRIDMLTYLEIDGLIYKVLKTKTFSDYMEVYLYLLERQVM